MSEERIWVKIPIPDRKGEAAEYVEVDPTRLGPETLSQLYVKFRPRDGAITFMPAAFRLAGLKTVPDTSRIDEKITEVLGQYAASLDSFEEAGLLIQEHLIEHLNFSNIFQNIAAGRIDLATAEMEGLMHSLLSGAMQIAQEMSVRDEHASGMTASFNSMSAIAVQNDEVTAKIYEDLVLALEQLLETTKALDALETDIKSNNTLADRSLKGWGQKLSSDNPVIQETLTLLDGDPSSGVQGLSMLVFQYMRDPEGVGDITEKIEGGLLKIYECFDLRDRLDKEWQKLRKEREMQIHAHTTAIEEHIRYLIDATNVVKDFFKNFGKDAPPPHIHPKFKHLISKERYEQAMLLTMEQRWAPRTTQRRLNTMVNTQLQVLGKPNFPSEILHQLELEKERFEEALEIDHETEDPQIVPPPAPPPNPDPKPEPPLTTPTQSKPPAASPKTPTVAGDRVEEVYEMSRALAFALTHNHYNLALTTPKSLVKILIFLGAVSQDEYEWLKNEIQDRVMADRYDRQSHENLNHLRKTVKETWVRDRKKKKDKKTGKNKETYWRMKITVAGAVDGPALLKKFGWEEEQLRAERLKYKEAKDRMYSEKKKQ